MRRYCELNWKLFNLFWRLKRWKPSYSVFSSAALCSALLSVAASPCGRRWDETTEPARPPLSRWRCKSLTVIDTVEICRAMFAGGCVAILLAIFSEVIYGDE
jgi:hypothetical protein